MRIIGHTPIIYNYNKPSFGTCSREYKNTMPSCQAGPCVYTKTSLFRSDLNFGQLADYIINNYKDKEKVNIYCLAGSDGSEAYSIAIALMERIPKNQYKKYFPIISIDKDKQTVETAQKGRINLCSADFRMLSKEVKSGRQYFVNRQPAIKYENEKEEFFDTYSYEPIPELRDAVVFKQSDLTEEISKIKDDGNSIVLCRNIFPYLHQTQISNTIYDMNETLKKGSLFAIGNFDTNTDVPNYLYYYDFIETLENVFRHP